ncbi:unnamed protein product [Prunus brigantina]
MDPELKPIITHLAKLKKAMAESDQQPEEAYAIKLQGWPCKTSEVDHMAKKKSKAKKPNPEADVDPKKSWYDWYKALEPKLKTSWQKSWIYDVLALCASGDFPCDRSLIIAGLCFWSSSVNCMRLRFGMMTPTLLDLAAIAGLHPHGVVYSAVDLPEPLLKPGYDKPSKNFTNWIKTYFGYTGSSSGAPIDHRYPDYLALDLASIPTLETTEERRELWASILISRDLPYGLALNKGNHYPCGCEVYYPAVVGRQMGFIQGVPSPMVDSHNYFSSWRVSFKKASEMNSVVNFNRELVKVCNFQTRDPEFGFTESFKACLISLPTSLPLAATKEASAGSSHSQDVGEGQNSSGYDVEIPPADDIILARPRKIPRNPLPPGSSRIVEQPNSTHLTMATHSAVSSSAIPEFRTPILETEVGGQIATSEVEVEVIGANLSTNPDVIVAETQLPFKNLHFLFLVNVVDHQTIPADQTANASGVPPVIPVTLSAVHASQIPQLPSDVSIPILTDQQPEVSCTAGALVESGSEQPLSTDQDDLIQSLLDHISITCQSI